MKLLRPIRARLILSITTILLLSVSLAAESQVGVKTVYINRSVDPCTDFYRYANGAWLDTAKIPSDRASWGAWGELYEKNANDLRGILDAAVAANSAKGTATQKVADFFKSGMDTTAIEAARLKPIQPELDRIAAIKDKGGVIDQIAHMNRMRIWAPIALEVYSDAKNASMNIAQLEQAGLGLPEREYYLKDDAESQETRQKYLVHVANIFQLLGESQADADKHAATVMALETRLATASMDQVTLRDPDSTYHKMSVAELKTAAPKFDWDRYFVAVSAKNPGDINNNQPAFMRELSAMMDEVPVGDWQTYFRWHLISEYAGYLSSDFVNESFDFNGKFLAGRKVLRPRWKRVMDQVDQSLGEALGKLYVEKHFSPESKRHAETMVKNLIASLRDRIVALDWISDATRKQALVKLDAVKFKIGYPDKWRDYSKLDIKTDSYAQNVMRSEQFEFQRRLEMIGKPVDRDEWYMTAPEVNAYYDAFINEIVFPAGILQPPFFDANIDDAINYGGIGSVIGHELTHGFDDEGRRYDATGNLVDWWTPGDAAKFEERAQMIIEQYNGYTVLDSLHVNGALTSGENIADVGGLKIAYYAYQKSIEGKRPADIDGFTPEQRFFIGFAHIWREKLTDELTRLIVLTDPHSPNEFRVNGAVSNLDEFAKAFGCKAGAAGVRTGASQVKIW